MTVKELYKYCKYMKNENMELVIDVYPDEGRIECPVTYDLIDDDLFNNVYIEIDLSDKHRIYDWRSGNNNTNINKNRI